MLGTRTRFGCAALLLAVGGASVAFAADGAQTSPGSAPSARVAANSSYPADAPPRHSPPPEAVDACQSLAEGDACSVTKSGHTMSGTCRKGPQGTSELACLPAHPPGPPPEAVEACKGAAEGATCSMILRAETVTGVCRKGPGDSSVVACAPAHPDPAPSSNSTLSGSGLEQQLDRLERQIQGD